MSPKLGKILYGEGNAQVSSTQVKVFEKAGFTVECAIGRDTIEGALKRSAFGLVILGHTLNKDDRHHLPYMAKKSSPDCRVLVLHSSGRHPAVDLAIDSRDGDAAVLRAVAALLALGKPERVPLRTAAAFA